MAKYEVSPTRMERTRQKGRLKTANRGYNLLKDKSDEMIRTFLSLIKQNRLLRERIESDLTTVLQSFMSARTQMTSAEIEDAVAKSCVTLQFAVGTINIMGLVVPEIELILDDKKHKPIFVSTPAIFDKAIEGLVSLTAFFVKLANIEKTCDMLADEIEKVRRRINSLQYIMIPNTKDTIKYITMKLEEDQRSQQVRIMKVKDLQIAHGGNF